MFANVSPASYNYDETYGTLRYASRAKLIKNAPKINEDPKDALLRKYEEEIKALKEQLASGGSVPGENKKRKKKKKKVKKSEENDEENGNNEENEEGDGDGDGEDEDDYNDFALVEDDPEKQKLKEKLAALEKNLLDNKKLEAAPENGKLDQSKIEEQEEENRKFREYREQQLKQNEELEKKLQKLQEERIKEEESLKNDANKLQKRIKELTSEIEDLKLDNGKDRTDYMEGVKAIYRDNQFYREIIRYMLSDSELKQIIEMSKYNEEEEKWHVQSFSFQEKSLALPSMKLGPLGGRFGGNNRGGNKQIIFQNYGEEGNNNVEEDEDDNDNVDNYEKNVEKDFEELKNQNLFNSKSKKRLKLKEIGSSGSLSNFNLNEFDDKVNSRINFRITKDKDKFVIDGKRQAKSQVTNIRNIGGANKDFYNIENDDELNNVNRLLNKKEREKFEQLGNGGMGKGYGNPMFISAANPGQMYSKSNKRGKIMLNPLGSNSGNKVEVSFKATVEINNKMPLIGNKKLQFV